MAGTSPLSRFTRASHWRDLLVEMVWRDLKIQYKRSVLGIFWSLLNPLMQFAVLVFVFQYLLRLRVPGHTPYAPFVFVGVLVWSWFSASVQQAALAVTTNPELVRHPGFPPQILPMVTVTKNLVHFVLAVPVLSGFLLASGVVFGVVVVWLPIVILVQYVLTLSLAYFVAALNVLFRDTQHIVGVLLLVAFYATPVFYSPEQVPERFRTFYFCNPMVHIIDATRAVLLRAQTPDFRTLGAVGTAAAVFLVFACWFYDHMSARFVDEV